MTIKGGADHKTVFDTVRIMLKKGMTVEQSIAEVEAILRGKLPDHIIALIRQECGQ